MSRPPLVKLPDWFGENRMCEVAVAAYCGDVQAVAAAIEAAGADLDHTDLSGYTALFWACFKSRVHDGYLPVVKLLLERGAKVNGAKHGHLTPLIAACRAGSPDVVAELLRFGADPNLPSNDDVPITAAACGGCDQCVELLLAAGAKVDAHGYGGKTAREWALTQGFDHVLAVLPTEA